MAQRMTHLRDLRRRGLTICGRDVAITTRAHAQQVADVLEEALYDLCLACRDEIEARWEREDLSEDVLERILAALELKARPAPALHGPWPNDGGCWPDCEPGAHARDCAARGLAHRNGAEAARC